MGVAVDTEAADTAASAAEDTRVSAAAPVRAELVVATAEPGSVGSGGSYGARHYSSGISTGRYGTYRGYGSYGGYGQRYYAPRTSAGNQIYRSSPSSQNRTASKQFARSPKYSGSYYVPQDRSGVGFARKSGFQPRIIRAPIAMFASNAPERLPEVQRGPTGLGRDRMQPTGSDSTLKQHKDCVTGKAKHLDGRRKT